MKLQPCQIMDLLNYTSDARVYLSRRITTKNHEQLIFGSTNQVRCITRRIIRNFRGYNRKVSSYSQIRSSLIVNWLKQHNLRKVQYLAGHRYISSTERYQQDDLENLHEIVNTLHPIS